VKESLRLILFRRPTLFPWLIIFLLGVMIYYIIIGLIAMSGNYEGLIALLIVPYLIPVMIVLAGADFALRSMLKFKLGIVWMIEVSLLLIWLCWFAWNNFYHTIFVTPRKTAWVVMVTDREKGYELNKGRNLLTLTTEITFPEDNILIVKENLHANEWRDLEGKAADGRRYTQISPMSYRGKDTLPCNGRTYPIQFFLLDTEGQYSFRMDDQSFDSICNQICLKIMKQQPLPVN
jgi:hypothetical protein